MNSSIRPTASLTRSSLLLLIAAGCSALAAFATGPAADEVLTVDQTLGRVFIIPDENNYALVHRANPAARGAIRRVLEDPGLERYHATAWRMLGYLGDSEDVDRLERRLRSFTGVAAGSDLTQSLGGMFDAIGLMCGRDVGAAQALMDRMQRSDFWDEVAFRWYDPRVKTAVPFAYDSIIRLMFGYSLARKPDLQNRVDRILASVGDRPFRNDVRWQLKVDQLQSRADEWLFLTGDILPVADLAMFFNGDLEHPGPASPHRISQDSQARQGGERPKLGARPEPILGDERTRLAAEAAGSYREIVDVLLRGTDGEVMGRLLDDGRPLSLRALGKRAEQRADLKRTREFVAKVRAIEGRPGEPRVERLREVYDGSEEVVILVTYELEGTKAVGSEIHPGPKSVGTVAADGNLVIYMKKINGKWYWNPFGW